MEATLTLGAEGGNGIPNDKVREGFLVWQNHLPFGLGAHQDVFRVIVGPEVAVYDVWVDEEEPSEVVQGR